MKIRTHKREIHFSTAKLLQIQEFLVLYGVKNTLMIKTYVTLRSLVSAPADVCFSCRHLLERIIRTIRSMNTQ